MAYLTREEVKEIRNRIIFVYNNVDIDAPGIYAILNKNNGKTYIGKTKTLRGRITRHIWYLANSREGDNKYLVEDFAKYHGIGFEIHLLENCKIDKLDEREIYYIDKFKTYSYDGSTGYNLTKGGIGSDGRLASKETRHNLSVSGKKRYKSGHLNPMLNNTHTPETRKILREKTLRWNMMLNVVLDDILYYYYKYVDSTAKYTLTTGQKKSLVNLIATGEKSLRMKIDRNLVYNYKNNKEIYLNCNFEK